MKVESRSDNREQQGVEPRRQDEGEDCPARCLRVQGRDVSSENHINSLFLEALLKDKV